MNIDVTKLCEARSDQLNAIDLISGPRVVKITDVKIVTGDQPIHVILDGDTNRPWKCSKTSVRVLAALYGVDAKNWIGKHIEIYCDETVVWGGMAVGGIRQSKAEGISKQMKLMLTKSRQKKEVTVINPLTEEIIAAKYKQEVVEPAPEPEPDTDTAAIQDQARKAASVGKKEFGFWWKEASKDERAACADIMDELKEACAKADAAAEHSA